MEDWQLAALSKRLNDIEAALARAQGALGAAMDVTRALMQTHPDRQAVLGSIQMLGNFPSPLQEQGYRNWLADVTRPTD